MNDLEVLKLLRSFVGQNYPHDLEEVKHLDTAHKDFCATFYDIFFIPFFKSYKGKDDLDKITLSWEEYISSGTFTKSFRYEFFKRYLNNIEKHSNAIQSVFNVKNIEYIGDPHIDIFKARIDNRVVYKKILGIEDFLSELIDLFPEFSDQIYKHDTVRKGRLEYIVRPFYKQKVNNIDQKNYYYNFGFLIPLILTLRMIDLTWENILISESSKPLLFDIEFLYTPSYKEEAHKYNITHSAIIYIQRPANVSALFGMFDQGSEFLTPKLVKTDEGHQIQWIPQSRKSSEKPILELPFKYKKDIEEGFVKGWSIIRERLEDLRSLIERSDFNTRMIIKPSAAYRYVLMMINYLDDDLSYKQANEQLKETLNTFRSFDAEYSNLENINNFDMRSIEQLLIPHHIMSVNNKNIIDPKENKTLMKFDITPKDKELLHLENFEAFMKEQKRLLLWNLSMAKRNFK